MPKSSIKRYSDFRQKHEFWDRYYDLKSSGWHYITLPSSPDECVWQGYEHRTVKIYQWLETIGILDCFGVGEHWLFKNPEDVILFKLRFG